MLRHLEQKVEARNRRWTAWSGRRELLPARRPRSRPAQHASREQPILTAGWRLQHERAVVDSCHMERSPSLLRRMLRCRHKPSPRPAERAWTPRLPTSLGLACAAGCVLSGCGGGQPAGSRSVSLRSSAAGAGLTKSRTSPNRSFLALRPTKTRALARFARAVNLTVADIPEGRVSKQRRNPASGERGESEHCVGALLSQQKLADVGSPTVLRGHELESEWIGSQVTVATSVGVADHLLATLQRPDVRRCLARVDTEPRPDGNPQRPLGARRRVRPSGSGAGKQRPDRSADRHDREIPGE